MALGTLKIMLQLCCFDHPSFEINLNEQNAKVIRL